MKVEEREKLKEKLIEIYLGYVKNINDKEIKSQSQNLFFEFVYANDSLDRDLMNAVNGLEHIGWEYSRSTKTAEHDWKMSQENAVKILNELRK